jgi:hypothetical protein
MATANVSSTSIIPIEYLGFRIIINSNILDLELKDRTSIKYIKSKLNQKIIDNDRMKLIFTVKFETNEVYIFNQILDNSDYNIDCITNAIDLASKYFTEYEVSRKTQNYIDKYINSLGRNDSTWAGIMSKPDYNMSLFKNRTLPFYNIECKDWVNANLEAIKAEYPTEIIRASNSISIGGFKKVNEDEFSEELNLATKNNNFLEWSILPVDKYPDMVKLTNRIIIFHNLGLCRQALMMFLRLLLSPKECHIIKESSLWAIFKPQMADNKYIEELVKYCCCYAMYILRQEETIMFSQVNMKYRVLFTLEQASNMPLFKSTHIERNPYILQLTDDSRISDCIPFYIKDGRSINNNTEFQRRFNLATGGAFKNVDLRSLGAAITGSILIPCVHTSPLEKGFENVDWNRNRKNIKVPHSFMVDTPDTPEDFAFLNYLEYYYPSYCSLQDDDYIKQVIKPSSEMSQIKDEIKYDTDETDGLGVDKKISMPSTTLVSSHTSLPKYTNQTIVMEEQENKSIRPSIEYNQLADIDISITTRDFDTFKKNALFLYNAIKANCEHRGEVYIKEIKTLASIKFKIYGPGISRPMDIFRIPYDPVKMVKKFHVHAVKMFYDNEVTLFRSCVACLLSGVGESYKWFSCNKVASDVLLKYAQRGLSIILNKKERDAISKYIMDNDRWGSMLKQLNLSADKIYACVPVEHPFFKPGLYSSGIRMTLKDFERDINNQYANSLVVSYPKSSFPFGEMNIKDNRKWYVPNSGIITLCLDYIESGDIEEEN